MGKNCAEGAPTPTNLGGQKIKFDEKKKYIFDKNTNF